MKLESVIAPYRFECLIKKHSQEFPEYDRKFLINMLTAATYNRDITQKQFDYCLVLIERLKTYEKLL